MAKSKRGAIIGNNRRHDQIDGGGVTPRQKILLKHLDPDMPTNGMTKRYASEIIKFLIEKQKEKDS